MRNINREHLVWKKFNNLTILGDFDTVKVWGVTKTYCSCKCNCGNTKRLLLWNVKSGNSKNCWCSRIWKLNWNYRHWFCVDKKDRFYQTYYDILVRCLNKENKSYKDYGGRWIKCEWENFSEFHRDMYKSYTAHLKKYWKENTTIERINNDWNYCRNNCWRATHKEQNLNKRNSKLQLSSMCRSWVEQTK